MELQLDGLKIQIYPVGEMNKGYIEFEFRTEVGRVEYLGRSVLHMLSIKSVSHLYSYLQKWQSKITIKYVCDYYLLYLPAPTGGVIIIWLSASKEPNSMPSYGVENVTSMMAGTLWTKMLNKTPTHMDPELLKWCGMKRA